MVVTKFSRVSTTTFKSLRVHHVTVAMQQTRLLSIKTSMLLALGGYGTLSPSEAATLDDSE